MQNHEAGVEKAKRMRLRNDLNQDSQFSIHRHMPPKQNLNVQSQLTNENSSALLHISQRSPEMIARLQRESINSYSNDDVIDEMATLELMTQTNNISREKLQQDQIEMNSGD